MKLKTLKDIEPFNDLNPRFVNRDRLKAEAIKWVKNCRCNRQGQVCQGCVRFRIFFNITEEDLK